MKKPPNPKELALDIMGRSICSVQVGACISDSRGIVSWGWNSVGSGFGEHAEAAAIRRANRKRLKGATIYVASKRLRTGKILYSYPCEACLKLIKKAGIKKWQFSVGQMDPKSATLGIWGEDWI